MRKVSAVRELEQVDRWHEHCEKYHMLIPCDDPEIDEEAYLRQEVEAKRMNVLVGRIDGEVVLSVFWTVYGEEFVIEACVAAPGADTIELFDDVVEFAKKQGLKGISATSSRMVILLFLESKGFGLSGVQMRLRFNEQEAKQ